MKQGLCLMIPRGTKSSEAINQAPFLPSTGRGSRVARPTCATVPAQPAPVTSGPWLSEPSLPSLKAAIHCWKP